MKLRVLTAAVASVLLAAAGPDVKAPEFHQLEAHAAVAVRIYDTDATHEFVVTQIEIQAPVARRWGARPPAGFEVATAAPDPHLQPPGAELTVLRWAGAVAVDPRVGVRIEIPIAQRTGERTEIQINYEVRRNGQSVGKGAIRFPVENSDHPVAKG